MFKHQIRCVFEYFRQMSRIVCKKCWSISSQSAVGQNRRRRRHVIHKTLVHRVKFSFATISHRNSNFKSIQTIKLSKLGLLHDDIMQDVLVLPSVAESVAETAASLHAMAQSVLMTVTH